MLWDWLKQRFGNGRTEERNGGWGLSWDNVAPQSPRRRALHIQLPYPTTIAFRFRCEDAEGNVIPAPVSRILVRRGTSEAYETQLLPPGTYYAGCSDLTADVVISEDPEDDCEWIKVWAWIPIVPDNLP